MAADEDLIKKFVDYISARPGGGNTVTLDDIQNTIATPTGELGGRAQLERLLAPPASQTIFFQKSAEGNSSVGVSYDRFNFVFTPDSPISSTPVKQIRGSSSMAQRAENKIDYTKATLLYNDPTQLTMGTDMYLNIYRPFSDLTVHVDAAISRGQPILFRIVITVPFRINDCRGNGSWA